MALEILRFAMWVRSWMLGCWAQRVCFGRKGFRKVPRMSTCVLNSGKSDERSECGGSAGNHRVDGIGYCDRAEVGGLALWALNSRSCCGVGFTPGCCEPHSGQGVSEASVEMSYLQRLHTPGLACDRHRYALKTTAPAVAATIWTSGTVTHHSGACELMVWWGSQRSDAAIATA